ncbi:uncharacterized protein BHQ10_008594 [Talaromyces amestolkiae]|uniref:Uncharacterized protein n=1 Tax=Talaromyces amestolkiae TaxID=1196081 RepID=A0A364L9U0_TALAM|nr:uncharacterized protein BHQ10_008594 [Talaromyces amestolkiae]RAO72582.1 hypothetical protein BHQ10_008594 [Talaromyces amestolkiae]
MALAAFFAANHIREQSQTGRDEELLTPHQLSLLLGLLSGGAEQLWDTVRYRCRRGRHLPKPIPLVFTTLSITMLLGFLIPAVDTWFGIVTTPVQVTQLQTITPPTKNFSRGLINICTNSDSTANSLTTTSNGVDLNGDYLPCTLASGKEGNVLQSDSEAYKIMNGISQTNTVRQYSSDPLKVFYYLSDSATSADVDYKATTFAVTTECEIITSNCNVNFDTYTFNCTPSFAGSLSSPGPAMMAYEVSKSSPVGVQYFGDPGLTNNFSATSEVFSPQNPLYFGTWATAQQAVSFADTSGTATFDGSGIGSSWILNCSSTIYEATYTWVNGTVTSFNTSLANGTVGGIFSAGFASGFGTVALENIATIAGFSNSSDGLANVTAAYFSQNSLALSIGAMDLRPGILEQSRSLINLTRVPLVPFYMLIVLKLFYAFSTVLFAFAVIIWAHPSESQDVKTRLSIKGLVVASFEPDKLKEKAVGTVEEMFSENSGDGQAENKKVGIVKTDQGGWAYMTTAVEAGRSVLGVISTTAKAA